MNNYILYMHTAPNNKRYIGITSRNPVRRWNGGAGYASNERFHADIIKYGWDNIKHEILMSDVSKEKAEEWELIMIKRYRTIDPEHGYNFPKGQVSKQARQRISEKTRKTSCICVETKKKYESITLAAEENHTSRNAVNASCKTDGKRKAGGKHFVYANPKRRQNAMRNEALRESLNWDWSWD